MLALTREGQEEGHKNITIASSPDCLWSILDKIPGIPTVHVHDNGVCIYI